MKKNGRERERERDLRWGRVSQSTSYVSLCESYELNIVEASLRATVDVEEDGRLVDQPLARTAAN